MRFQDIDFTPDQLRGLTRLVDKMAVSSVLSRESGELCHRTFGFTIKAGSLNEETRSVDVIASTDAIDSYDEIVEQDWRLERFKKNPVILYNHNSVGLCGPVEETLPIGHASNIQQSEHALAMRLHFVDEKANPLAEKVWQGVRQGSLRATSVGFRPGKVTKVKEGDEKEIVHLSENELFEVSVCPIPANPEAVARSVSRNREQALRLATSPGGSGSGPAPAVKAPSRKAKDEDEHADLEDLPPGEFLRQVFERERGASELYPSKERSEPARKPAEVTRTPVETDEQARRRLHLAKQDAHAAAFARVPGIAARLGAIK
jgi:HK97 family phage prohead protease